MTTKSLLCTSAVLLSGLAPALIGCRNTAGAQMAPIVDGTAAATDPTAANFAAPYAPVPMAAHASGSQKPTPYLVAQNSYPQQSGAYPQQGNSQQNEAYRYNTQPPQNGQYNTGNYGVQQNYGNQPGYSQQQGYADPQYGQQPQYAQQGYDPNAEISDDEYAQYQDLLDPNVPEAQQPPPPLPTDYEQPEAPGDDYLWTPGYWDYATTGYYYVPGAWVAAPYPGALWTPGWWGYVGNGYRWHHGYWGRHVGFYGGVNYGFGYIGFGYQGGYWNNDHFFFNLAVNRVRPGFNRDYTYNRRVTVVNNVYVNNSRTSYFGGPNGLHRGPAPQEFAARREQRIGPMQAQIANRQAAQGNRQQFFRNNNGRPQMLTASRPLQADRNIQAPPRTGNGFGQPGNRDGLNRQEGFVNGSQAGQRPGFDRQPGMNGQTLQQIQQRQQQDRFSGQQNQVNDRLQQQQFQRDQQQNRFNGQQDQINNRLQQQQFQRDQQLERFRSAQGQGLNGQQPSVNQQPGVDAQRLQQFQQQRQLNDAQRQQFDQQRLQQFQQQRQMNDQRMQQAESMRQQMDTQRQQQRQQFDQQRQAQQQMNQQQRQQAIPQHFDAPRPSPSVPRMDGTRPGGGGDHHR